ncbi:MAG TPA: penicillin-binding protein, partial [Rhizobiales bacterium]|nr:penicillin-binding protein [Hyphomicrobiales bacterium]
MPPGQRVNRRKPRRKARRKSPGVFAILKKLTYWSTVAGLWLGLGFAGLMAYYALSLPGPDKLKVPQRAPSILILDRHGGELARRGAYRGNALRIEEMPPYLLQAVISTEDRRFYSHFGVDPLGLARAVFANLFAGRIVQGGSTISQQLAKNLFLKPDRTFSRKMREFQLALWLERNYSKKQILEMYLNRVYLGAGTFGVDAAAQRYFGKSARHVTLGEAATLAGLLKAPSRYAPNKNPKLARARTALVLNNMRSEGYISEAELRHALKYPGRRAIRKPLPGSGYAVDWVAGMLREYTGELNGDVIVETTLDRSLQKKAQQIVRDSIRREGGPAKAAQAALVCMDEGGAIRALVGGVDYGQSQFNRAVRARRQPGSAFKPFVYLAAIEAGLSPRTIRTDRPMVIRGWMPRNYSGKYTGKVSLQDALARSINTVAAGLAKEVGIKKVISTARRLGISSPLHRNPSISLGTAEVSLLELTGAYTPFMN